MMMQTNGNGVLGTVNSITTSGLPSGVAAQFGMAKPPGAQLFYYNQTVQVYDPTLTTNRGSANVLLVDPFNSLLQVDALPTGTSVNDVIVHDGLTGAQPTSLFGILYHQTNATTGTWLNLNRSTYPVELATPAVNGNNSAITPGAVRLAINKVRKSLGSNQVSKLLVALGPRGDAGHRFLRCRRANCVSDLRHQRRIVGGVYLLFRHRISGLE